MSSRDLIRALTLASFLATASNPGKAASYEGLNVNADAGYSLILPEGMAYPSYINGAAARARVGYGIDKTWQVAASLGLSWYQPYTPYDKVTSTTDGSTSTSFAKGTPVERLRIQDFSLMAIYVVDVYRLVPSLALGVSSARILEDKAGSLHVSHDLAVRFEVSLDISVNDHIALGAVFGLDTFVLDRSPYTTRNNFLLRATFHWDVRNLGRGRNNR